MMMWRAVGLLASACLTGAVIVACRPTGGVGYVEIKTVPVAPLTQTVLFFDSTRLDPIRNGSAVLRQSVGTLRLQAGSFGGALAPLCDIEVKRNRITTVTISVLDRPPRCVCRFSGAAATASHTCVS
jgi:hypothetical protein